MSALFLGFIFTLALMACFIGISMLHARSSDEPHPHHHPTLTDAEAIPPPPRHDAGR
jgi:hypothetical protein